MFNKMSFALGTEENSHCHSSASIRNQRFKRLRELRFAVLAVVKG